MGNLEKEPMILVKGRVNSYGNDFNQITLNGEVKRILNSKEVCIETSGRTITLSRPHIDSIKTYRIGNNGYCVNVTIELEYGYYYLVDRTEDYLVFEKPKGN